MEVIEDNQHIDNVYAYDEDFKEIYIGHVDYENRGIRKNYFCLGCKRKMQAVLPLTKRKKHFRHDAIKSQGEKKCTYNDETYRHKLAKELIQNVKKIKVPALYKYDPEKKSNEALLIKESHFIEFSEVLIERRIYENEKGEIEYIHKEDRTKSLLIKPDAILLNNEGKPILIVEFVATHKPDINKLIKLKRLGIDAIQISIPKSSPEEIEKCFSITKHTKWLFNNEESNTDYLQFSNEYSGAIFEVDQEQRKLFEEGYKCRSTEIKQLIRTIDSLLQTEHYQTIERNLRSEIQRVERNSSAARERLEDVREGYIREGIEYHSERRKELTFNQDEFSNYRSDLEKRYFKRRRELEFEKSRIEQSIAEIEYANNKLISATETTYHDIETAKGASARIRREIEDLGDRKRSDELLQWGNFEESKGRIESSIERVRNQIGTLSEIFEREENRIRVDFEIQIKGTQNEIFRIDQEQKSITEAVPVESGDIGTRIESNNKQLLLEFKKGENSSIRRIASEHRKLHEFEHAILVYKSTHDQYTRIEGYLRKKT